MLQLLIMKIKFFLIITIFTGFNLYSQNIAFTDLNLKAFLINENCIDTNNDNIPDTNADLNNDNNIQISEALSFTNLYLETFPDNYHVESIQDISHFSNLNKLSIIHFDSLEEISLLGLTSLTILNIGSCYELKYIDISDLPNIIDQRIEDIGQLEYLNIQNNNFPSSVFSLFYTENIQYACIDNISEEYDVVSQHMLQGQLPTIDCSLSVQENDLDKQLILFPNPTSDTFTIASNNVPIFGITIIDMNGKTLLTKDDALENIDVSFFNSGIYFVKIIMENTSIIKKLIKL